MERFKGRQRSRSRSRYKSYDRYERKRARSRSRSKDRRRRDASYDAYNNCDIQGDWGYGVDYLTNPSLAILSNPGVNMMFRKYFCEFAESGRKKKEEGIATIDLTKRDKRKNTKKHKQKKSKKKKRRKSSSSSSSSSSSPDTD